MLFGALFVEMQCFYFLVMRGNIFIDFLVCTIEAVNGEPGIGDRIATAAYAHTEAPIRHFADFYNFRCVHGYLGFKL